jgi:CMP-N-acetylneuraminic acid synthetase
MKSFKIVKNSISVFLPTRNGSERVPNKNTRKFATFDFGLLQNKLEQLSSTKNVSEIVLSSNDLVSIEFAKLMAETDHRIKINVRPNYLASSQTNLVDLINYVPSVCNCEHILWTHVTSPFINGFDYDAAIESYFSLIRNGFDSMMSGKRVNNFLWSNETNDLINRNGNLRWPRTQDLKPFYEIDSGFFISSKLNYLKYSDRVGVKPFLFEQEGFKSFDIDWESDFLMAESIYKFLVQ